MRPKLVMSSNSKANKDADVDFAIESGFDGVDWSFAADRMPFDDRSKPQFFSHIQMLYDCHMEVRFHTPFINAEIGHRDHAIAQRAMDFYFMTLELIAVARGQFHTLHVGIGNIPDEDICLAKVQENLGILKVFGLNRGVTIALENLMYGPTSVPERWIELLENAGLQATFDFGHAKGCDAVVKGLWSPLEVIHRVRHRLVHAHIYKEEDGIGHVPPETIEDMGTDLLDVLIESSCRWWVVELPERDAALRTKEMLERYVESALRGV